MFSWVLSPQTDHCVGKSRNQISYSIFPHRISEPGMTVVSIRIICSIVSSELNFPKFCFQFYLPMVAVQEKHRDCLNIYIIPASFHVNHETTGSSES